MKYLNRSSIDPGKGQEMTSRTLKGGGEILLFAFLTIVLPACSVLEAQNVPATQQITAQADSVAQQTEPINQAEIPLLAGVNGVEQQGLIEEINSCLLYTSDAADE